MMCHRKDDNSLGLGPVDKGERETVDKDTTGIRAKRRTRLRKCKGSGGSFLHRRSKARAQSGFDFTVIDNLGEKLEACGGDEPRANHRASRLASANTVSAENVGNSPRS
jgi:hypothetical protein